MAKILFILKRRDDYSTDTSYSSSQGLSSGLFNSVKFIADAFPDDVAVEIVIDNNCIDRVVTLHKPDVVVVEGLWVIPSKFDILQKLHPTVKWIVRTHSKTAFVAGEGMAMDWLFSYVDHPNVYIAANSESFYDEICSVLNSDEKVMYLPNIYPHVDASYKEDRWDSGRIYIGCFGAVRPLKNHLLQAKAAIVFAEKIGEKLSFHINLNRLEMKGEPVLRNLEGLFNKMEHRGHKLVLIDWMDHDDFVHSLKYDIDIGMQVSLSETFNIVAADMVAAGKPIVVSNEVPWSYTTADPRNLKSMVNSLLLAHKFPKLNLWMNKTTLNIYSHKSKVIWRSLINSMEEL